MKSLDKNIIKTVQSLSGDALADLLDTILPNDAGAKILLKYVKKQETLEAITKNYGYFIKFINNPSERVQLEAVKSYEDAIKFY